MFISALSPFEEMIHRVPHDQLEAVEKQMNCVQITHRFLKAIGQGDMQTIAAIPNYPLVALLALKLNKISTDTFASICLYYGMSWYPRTEVYYNIFADRNEISCRNNMDIKVTTLSLFMEDDKVNPDAKTLITKTLLVAEGSELWSSNIETKTFLSEEKLDLFFEQMRNAPPLQRQMFICQDHWLDSPVRKIDSICGNILKVVGFNVFGSPEKGVRLFPSVRMMQTFLNICAKEDAVKVRPVLGFSSVDDLARGMLENARDLALCFPGIPLPQYADEMLAFGCSAVSYHDFYHSTINSLIPLSHRERFLKIADIVKECIPFATAPRDGERLEKLREKIVDMEYDLYLLHNRQPKGFNEYPVSLDDLFFFQLHRILCIGISRLSNLSDTLQWKLLDRITKYTVSLKLPIPQASRSPWPTELEIPQWKHPLTYTLHLLGNHQAL